MANNRANFRRSLLGHDGPCYIPGIFLAGASQAIKMGEIITIAGGTWAPLASDTSMAGVIAVAGEEIKSGDRAGYYPIIVPRPGDVFEFLLAAAGATALAAPLYWSSSQILTATPGSNIIGYSAGIKNYPYPQGHTADDASGDMGTVLRSQSSVEMVFKASVSYWAALNP